MDDRLNPPEQPAGLAMHPIAGYLVYIFEDEVKARKLKECEDFEDCHTFVEADGRYCEMCIRELFTYDCKHMEFTTCQVSICKMTGKACETVGHAICHSPDDYGIHPDL